MKIVADFHIHSKYSRATSPQMDLENIDRWAGWKGINLVGTGDFTHPFWFSEIKNKLKEKMPGIYALEGKETNFILTAEISSIYSEGGKVRKNHNVIFAPSIATVEKINNRLGSIGNLYADGRPILGLSSYDLLKIILEIDEKCILMPAHIWTPWFSLFGSNSGFDSIKECFRDLSDKIYAVETGLSSDPPMNWRLSQLDPITLISCSDAHSPANLGRELTVFDLPKLSYEEIYSAIKKKDPKRILYTVEFFPEEGKYHFDGHRNCGIRFSPSETKKHNQLCPKCGKPITVGVLNRVEKLADRPEGFKPKNAIPYKSLVQLDQVIAESLGVRTASKKVLEEYQKLISAIGNELDILLETPLEKVASFTLSKIVDGIKRVREGKICINPGFDGEFGTVTVFNSEDEPQKKQTALF